VDPSTAPPFEVVETAAGKLYRLPPRRLGALRLLAALPLLLAVVGTTFVLQFYFTRAARGPLNEWAWAIFILTGLGWARACYTLASLAAVIACGRTEIEVADNGTVWATDRVGWFRVRWGKLTPGTARKLLVSQISPVRDAAGKPLTDAVVPWHLSVETDRGRKVWLAPAHPCAVLAAVAGELAQRLALTAPLPLPDPDTGEPLPAAASVTVPVVVEELQIPSRDVLEQPPASRVVLERHPDGVTITVPRLGLAGGNGLLVVVGVIFATLGAIFTVAALLPLFQANPQRPSGVIFVGVIFFLVGSTFAILSVNAAMKRVVLAVVGDQLLTFETGPFGSRRRSFIRAELLDVACGPSNVSVNNKPLPQLQFTIVGSKTRVGLLTGRDEAELKWLATVLRQSLGIPGEAPEARKAAADPAKPWR
jgi:hypothetical protein